ncbi:hypothetical protein [Companilactobacillus ginsenosidimutans]|uniref:Uncharacterized protein n=1 Tax=Companilactobacillus ginsenosidimutans TaxID=1007676 RepID=A0A0H4QJH8_9LACO|nr:hypothetical protein [Companilactobacillus ginsenosidimutans]AKP66833.1 hypothetical protein ABM34_04150 [Companilactobacillus ginsenosidimutans]
MTKSEYFGVQVVDDISKDNQMDPYMAMDLEFTFGVMETEKGYETFRKEYDAVEDERFKGMVSDSMTVPMKSLGLNEWFDDYLITFKDQATLDNFKKNLEQILKSKYDEATKLVGEQLMVAIVEGLPSVGHDDYLKTKNAMANRSVKKVYRVQGVGTVGFIFSDEDIAMQVAEKMYQKAAVKLNEMDPEFGIKSDMILDYPTHLITYSLNEKGVYVADSQMKRLVPSKNPSEIEDYK